MIGQFGAFEYALSERYRFESQLGRGGMGTVYRARDVRLGRPVAIKLLHPSLTNALGVARFQSEIRISAGLHHPHIVGVHDSGEADGRLYYVMDYLDGETLRARLLRERQLTIEEAQHIARQVGAALQYAHDHGVVHRDIKPENILIAGGGARVVDFGLARSLDGDEAERLTASGLSVGTPHYLSPEQASAEKHIGPKADQYALGCVVYEMLAGEPPFSGPTASAIAMRHVAERPALLRSRRRTTPPHVEAAVAKALEKIPADRYGSVSDFVAALTRAVVDSAPVVAPAREAKRGLPRKTLAAIAIVAVLGGLVGWQNRSRLEGWWLSATAPRADALRLAVFAPDDDTSGGATAAAVATSAAAAIDRQILASLAHWQDLEVVDGAALDSVRAAVARRRPGASPREIAAAAGAARFLTARLSGDARRITIAVGAVQSSSRPRTIEATLGADSAANAEGVDRVIREALAPGPPLPEARDIAASTRSLAAFQSYAAARTALETWNLPRADSAFADALRADSLFGASAVGLAETRFWRRDGDPRVASLLRVARNGADRLPARVRAHAEALSMLTSGDPSAACARYGDLVRADSADFGAWYGLGECNRVDDVVVPARAGGGRFEFRGDLQRAMSAFARAFALLPAVDSCCAARAALVQSRFLVTRNTAMRFGRGLPPAQLPYAAYPELVGDSLVFRPATYDDLTRPSPTTHLQAVEAQRARAFRLAAGAVSAAPRDPSALELLANAMELRGDAATVDTIRRARALATDESQRLRLAIQEVLLGVKTSLPSDVGGLVRARTLAESLVVAPRASSDGASALAAVAALIGEPERAAAQAQRAPRDGSLPIEVPADVERLADGYLAYAAAGGPLDSLRSYDRRLTSGIRNRVLVRDQARARETLIGQGAGVAFPVYRSEAFDLLDSTSDDLIRAEGAWSRRDGQGVRAALARIAASRVNLRPADITLDASYPETWLLAAVGDTVAARRALRTILSAVPSMATSDFRQITNTGVLIRIMRLYVDLTKASDPAESRVWATAVHALTQAARP